MSQVFVDISDILGTILPSIIVKSIECLTALLPMIYGSSAAISPLITTCSFLMSRLFSFAYLKNRGLHNNIEDGFGFFYNLSSPQSNLKGTMEHMKMLESSSFSIVCFYILCLEAPSKPHLLKSLSSLPAKEDGKHRNFPSLSSIFCKTP
jgi:hypothetical protein